MRLNSKDLRPLPWQCGTEQYLWHQKQFFSNIRVMLCNSSYCTALKWPVCVCIPVQIDQWYLQARSWEPHCSLMMPREGGACCHGHTSPSESHDQGVGGNYTVSLELLRLFRHLTQDNNAGEQGSKAGDYWIVRLCYRILIPSKRSTFSKHGIKKQFQTWKSSWRHILRWS